MEQEGMKVVMIFRSGLQ